MYDFFENHFVHESSSGIKVELKEYNLLRLTVNLPLSEISLELFFFFFPSDRLPAAENPGTQTICTPEP